MGWAYGRKARLPHKKGLAAKLDVHTWKDWLQLNVNENQRDNPETPATMGTQDEDKQSTKENNKHNTEN